MGWKEEREKELEKVIKKTGLTREEIEDLSSIMNATWQEIGGDWLSDVAGIGYSTGKTISRSEVVEAVTDADRMRTHCEWRGKMKDKIPTVEKYYRLSDAQRKVLDKFAFPFTRYGW